MKLIILRVIILFCLFSIEKQIYSAIAPLSLEKLKYADAIVVGEIKDIRVESEKKGFGKSNWAIYLNLDIKNVEKGDFVESEIEFKCLRIKSRLFMYELFAPVGHESIPQEGTLVRVYLEKKESDWCPLLPNGITKAKLDDDKGVSNSAFKEAEIVTDLGFSYTLFFPLEVWILILMVVIAIKLIMLLIKYVKNVNRKKVTD